MTNDSRRLSHAVVGALLLLGLGALPALRAQDPMAPARRAAEIHEAIAAQGIPVASVRYQDGRYQLVPGPSCSAGQLAQAEQIMSQLLGEPPATIAVDNLQDALVVIQFEPGNESARKLLKQRYEELEAAARKAQ